MNNSNCMCEITNWVVLGCGVFTAIVFSLVGRYIHKKVRNRTIRTIPDLNVSRVFDKFIIINENGIWNTTELEEDEKEQDLEVINIYPYDVISKITKLNYHYDRAVFITSKYDSKAALRLLLAVWNETDDIPLLDNEMPTLFETPYLIKIFYTGVISHDNDMYYNSVPLSRIEQEILINY